MNDYIYPPTSCSDELWDEYCKEKDFNIVVTQTLSKREKLRSSNFKEYFRGLNDDGYPEYSIDTSCINWKKEYEKQCLDIPFLLDTLKMYALQEIERIGTSTDKYDKAALRLAKHVLQSCKEWELLETKIVEEE